MDLTCVPPLTAGAHRLQVKPALAGQARSLAGRFDFWGVGDLPDGYRPAAGGQDEALNAIDHFEFGASMRQGLEIAGEIHARTPKGADKMAESMQLIEAMLKSQPSPANGTKIDLQSANGTVKLLDCHLRRGFEEGHRSAEKELCYRDGARGLKFAGGVAGLPQPPCPSRP